MRLQVKKWIRVQEINVGVWGKKAQEGGAKKGDCPGRQTRRGIFNKGA